MLETSPLFANNKLKELFDYILIIEKSMLSFNSGSEEHEEAIQMAEVVRNLLVIIDVDVLKYDAVYDFLKGAELASYNDLKDDLQMDTHEVLSRIIPCVIGVIDRLDEIPPEELASVGIERDEEKEREILRIVVECEENSDEFESKLFASSINTSAEISNSKFTDPDLDFLDDFFESLDRVNDSSQNDETRPQESKNSLIQVDSVVLSDGKRYSGWGYNTSSGFVPHGVGKKFYSDFEAWGNFIDGELNGPAMDNHHYCMTTGIFKANRLNGWGVSFNRGILSEFGYFENSQLKTDLTDMVEWFYEKVIKFWDDRKSGMATTYTHKETHMMHDFLIGWSYMKLSPGCTRHQMGFNFMLDGTLWVGITNKMDMTGTLMKFQNDGHIIIGKFDKGVLVEPLSFKEWFNDYTSQPPHIAFEVDPNRNYFL